MYVLQLDNSVSDFGLIGGKAANLCRIMKLNVDVPAAFIVTTSSYNKFIIKNKINTLTCQVDEKIKTNNPDKLQQLLNAIEAKFISGIMPREILISIRKNYGLLVNSNRNFHGLAVRSSSIAEDLPNASFAGQQETYLNVLGWFPLLVAIKRCWASLWALRAVLYRRENNVTHDTLSMAVIVQHMIGAKISGVVFTANPVTGSRNECIINSSWGLGDAVVSGQVTPDTIIVDKPSGKVKFYEVGEKSIMTTITTTGIEQVETPLQLQSLSSLTPLEIANINTVAKLIETEFGEPVDIEWCLTENMLYIVQARPITTLA